MLFSTGISDVSPPSSSNVKKLLHEKLQAMERQKSFIIKPTRLSLIYFTIPSSLLFFFLFSFWALNTTPSPSHVEAHLHFKAQAFVALNSNFSFNESKDHILRESHLLHAADSAEGALSLSNEWKDELSSINAQALAASTSNFSVNENKDAILRDAHVTQAADSTEEALDLSNELTDDILGNADSDGKNAILNPIHLKAATNISELGVKLVEEEKTAGSDVSNQRNEKFEATSSMSNESFHSAYSSEEKIEEGSECDISDGKWVFDESYPLYTSNSCPYIDEGFSCEANGRLDKDYMKWRWQTNQCSIPRFNPVKMLELIRGKRMVFVGDSINRNQWESMLCMLRGAISDPTRVYEARGRRITKARGNYNFKFADYQCSVEYYLSHFLVHESKARVGQKRVKTLRIDAIDRGSSRWRGADILVFNTAHWWSHYKTKSGLNYYQEGDLVHPHLDANIAFKRALTTWGSWVDRYITPGKTQVFFRSSAPSHFSGGEWNAGGHCRESTKPVNDTRTRSVPEKNLIVEEVIKQMRTPVTILNITNLSGLRIDGHPSIYGRRPANGVPSSIQDCSHWCLPGVPDTWNELLYYGLLFRQRTVSVG